IGDVVRNSPAPSRRQTARRTLILSGLAALLGLAGGVAAWLLLHLIGLITNGALLGRWAWKLPSFRDFHPGAMLVVAAVLGGLVGSLFARWAPVTPGPSHHGALAA